MLSYLVRRLVLLPLTLLGVATVTFIVLRVIPGDPALQLAGDMASRQDVESIRHQLGLDQSLAHQYLSYLGNLIRGELGFSFRTRTPVLDEIVARFGPTLLLGLAATLFTTLIGFVGGVVASFRRGGILDRIIFLASVVGLSLPSFWLGLVLIWLFSVRLKLLPVGGSEGFQSLILPTISLALGPAAVMARTVRSSMVESLDDDYIRTARSKGLAESRVVLIHALRNALVPAVTLLGLNFGALLSGAVIVELVFSWPGMGRLLIEALQYRDFPVIQGITLAFAAVFLLANIIVDVLYSAIDPRIRYA